VENAKQAGAAEPSALRDKVMLITGGASGLGRDVALQAAAAGAKLALFDVRADRLAKTKQEAEQGGVECLTFPGDVSDESQVAETVTSIVARLGRLDVVVNSAGLYRGGLVVDTSMADFDLLFRVNVRGTFLVCREAAKVMIPRRSGHLINIASIGAKHVFPREVAYASTKWAVIGISEGLSVELGPHAIRVTTICPGGMNTPFWDDIRLTRESWDPSRMLDSAHVARSIVQIASLPSDIVIKEALVYRPGL
jgi:NAD(P)-dependent dehydrogenase (short-subunit alcohol dehydrogenase family)